MEENIFYHEDLYRQIELIPRNNPKALRALHNTHVPDGGPNGFWQITIREEHGRTTRAENISVQELTDLVKKQHPHLYSSVTTGYSTTETLRPFTQAFGFAWYSLFVEREDTWVKHIFICRTGISSDADVTNRLASVLHDIGCRYDLILVDWEQKIALDLSLLPDVIEYLS